MAHPFEADIDRSIQHSLREVALAYLGGSGVVTIDLSDDSESKIRRIKIQLLAGECLRITVTGDIPDKGKYQETVLDLPNPELDPDASPSQKINELNRENPLVSQPGGKYKETKYGYMRVGFLVSEQEVPFDPRLARQFADIIKQAIEPKE